MDTRLRKAVSPFAFVAAVLAMVCAMAFAPQSAWAASTHVVSDPIDSLSSEAADMSRVVYVRAFRHMNYGTDVTVSNLNGMSVGTREWHGNKMLVVGPSGGSAKVTYHRIGYKASDGKDVDAVVTISATVPGSNPVGCYDIENSEIMSWSSEPGTSPVAYNEKVEVTMRIDLFESDSGAALNAGIIGMGFTDIDVPDWIDDSDYNSMWAESIELVDKYDNDIYIGEAEPGHHVPTSDDAYDISIGKRLQVLTHNGHPLIRSSHVCLGEDYSGGTDFPAYGMGPFKDSTAAFLAYDGFTFIWRGGGCGTVMGWFVNFKTMPGFTPTKAVPNPVARPGTDTVTMNIDASLPHVTDSNQAKSITFSDGLHAAFDPSTAVLKVYKKNDSGNWTDVSSNWTITDHTRELKAVAKDTSEGKATGDHRFQVTAKLKHQMNPSSDPALYDYSGLPTATYNGHSYARFTNTASVVAVPQRGSNKGGSTNTVNLYVPYVDKNLKVKKVSDHLDGGLKAGQFTFVASPSGSNSVTRDLTATNNAAGNVNFETIRFFEPGNYKYTITERDPYDPLVTADTHSVTGTIGVTWNATDKVYTATDTYSGSTDFTNIGPPPAPTKSVDKTTAEVDEIVTYSVVQTSYDGWKYSSLVFSDQIPEGTEYVANSAKLTDKSGNTVGGTENLSGGVLTYTTSTSWLESNQDASEKMTLTFKVKVLESAAGGSFTNKAKTITNKSWTKWTPEVTTEVPVWYVTLHKESASPDFLVGNSAYHIDGAEFTVTDSAGVHSGALVTKADGSTNPATVTVTHSGTATVREILPPLGHNIPNPDYKTVNLTRANAGSTLTVDFADPVIALDVPVIAHKVDSDYAMFGSEMGDAPWQGNALNFSGFKVRVDFYAGSKPTGTKLASAVFQSNSNGAVNFATATPVDGTSWRYVLNGRNVLPLGCVTVTEVAAPAGYEVDSTVHVAKIIQDGTEAVLIPGDNWS